MAAATWSRCSAPTGRQATTLRAISGLLKHGPGTVRLAGSDLAGITPTARARMGIAHVPPDRGLFFGLTVAEHFRLDGVAAADLDGRVRESRPPPAPGCRWSSSTCT